MLATPRREDATAIGSCDCKPNEAAYGTHTCNGDETDSSSIAYVPGSRPYGVKHSAASFMLDWPIVPCIALQVVPSVTDSVVAYLICRDP